MERIIKQIQKREDELLEEREGLPFSEKRRMHNLRLKEIREIKYFIYDLINNE